MSSYRGWTCGKCGGPVAGKFDTCKACGHPEQKADTPMSPSEAIEEAREALKEAIALIKLGALTKYEHIELDGHTSRALAALNEVAVSGVTVDGLANEIRRVDGDHSLGAGMLAEMLMPFIRAALFPLAERCLKAEARVAELEGALAKSDGAISRVMQTHRPYTDESGIVEVPLHSFGALINASREERERQALRAATLTKDTP